MIDRITKNEERLDNILLSINKLDEALKEFRDNEKNIYLVNKYYGSNSWFKDKEAYEKKEISQIKAGILSEDTVWNMLCEVDDIMLEMTKMVNNYKRKKK